ncbi:hypothetical protein J4470_01970 [Candidatus Woesearchaeota archaeon]|nr:hypothetical protein [Candidatus Woesearchaeota archaeon]
MNVEETVKINKLAKELLAHRIAENSEQATLKAEEMIRKRNPVEAKEKTLQQTSPDTGYFENIARHLSSNIRELASAVNRIRQEQAALKAQVDELRMLSEKKHAATAEESKELAQKEDENLKTGFSGEDIAIDKIFYFGKK